MKTIKLILACFLIPLLGLSQQYYTRTFNIDDGLPSNHVNCLYQDPAGYLWIGTDAGIGIFNGTEFKIINKNDGLASNDVRSITQDEEGTFWFACYDGGVTKFDGTNFISFTVEDGLHSNFIRRVYYSKIYQTLFIGGDDGFYTYAKGKFEFYGKANGKLTEEHEILWFMEDKGFVYVFPFKDFAIKFYPENDEIIQMNGLKEESDRWWSLTSAFVTSKQDTIWGNKFAISNSKGIFYPPTSKAGLVFNITEDDDGNVWLPIWGSQYWGIVRYNGTEFEDYSSKLGLDNIKCNSVLFDKNNNTLFIGTDGNGLKAFPKKIFTYYPTKDFTQTKSEYRKLFYHNGSPCLLYKYQIIKLNPYLKPQVIPIDILEKSDVSDLIKSIKLNRETNNIDLNTELWRLPEFYDVAYQNNSELWLSTTVGFFNLSFDLKNVVKAVPIDTRYGQIAFDARENLYNWGLWLSTLDIIPNPQNQKSPFNYQKYSQKNVDLPKEISKMLPVGDGMLFASLYGGLYHQDGSTFTHLNKANPELPENVSDMCHDIDGNVVFCSNTGEIGVGSITDGQFNIQRLWKDLDKSYGKNFMWVICDKHYNIYVGTNRGMLVIHNPPVYSSIYNGIRFFSKSEGYTDFSVSSPILDDEGNVWVASQDNLIQIDAEAINAVTPPSDKLILTQFETTDSTFVLGSVDEPTYSKDWSFPYNSNNLTFHFNSINLINPDKDRFFVQLDGFDKAFRDIGIDRKVNYTNLPAGHYKFTIRSNNLNTLQKQSQTLLEFDIRPPYWQTWWFYLIVSIFIVGLVILLYNLRVKRIRKTAMVKLEMANLEMQALQSQMNPHFVFNVFNSLQRYILESDVDKGIMLLSDFSKMIRQTFNLSSKKIITLTEEINYLDSYLKLEQVRFANKFSYSISADSDLNISEVMIPAMLIQPMVENAVKHGLSPLEGKEGMLTVTFSSSDGKSLKCEIKDNGIGIDKSLAAKRDNTTRLSKALTITQRRIDLLGASSKNDTYSVSLTDWSKLDPNMTGTLVEIILPIQID